MGTVQQTVPRLRSLSGPMLVEHLLRMTVGGLDVVMLGLYSQKAVAAVGLANQFAMFVMLVYTVVATGTTIVVSQNLGAGDQDGARQSALGSFVLAGIFGVVVSLAMVAGAPLIFSLYPLEAEVEAYATLYLQVYGAGSVFVAVNLIQSGLLRTWGHAKDPLGANILALVVNLTGNYVSIFGLDLGFFRMEPLGVGGVAGATVLSQVFAMVFLAWRIRVRGRLKARFREVLEVPGKVLGTLLRFGIPSAGEGISYNTASMALMSFAALLGTATMSAWVYNMTIARFVFALALAVGAGTQVQVGWWAGARSFDLAYRRVWQHYLFTLGAAVLLSVTVWLLRVPLTGLLTRDAEVAAMVHQLLFVGMFLEPGRSANLVIIPGLKGAGDVRFPVLVGIVSMWGVAVFGGWLLAIHWSWGFIGIWIALASDEWLRGIIMMFRWRSRRWERYALYRKAPVAPVLREDELGASAEDLPQA